MDLKLLALVLVSFASRSSAIPIQCHEEVAGVYFGSEWVYEFTAEYNTTIQPSTCGYTFSWDTYIEVRQGGVVLEFSDNLGDIVCPGSPQASAVTVHVTAGLTYEIVLRHGQLYTPQPAQQFRMNMYCSERIEAYWATMYNNTGYDFSLFSCFNNIWFYDGVSTCVGKGQYWDICPFHFLHCAGDITYGWGSQQRDAVIDALAMPNGKYPGFDDCPIDLECTGQQYTCLNEMCVDQHQLCDGTDDCGDGVASDEDNGINLGMCDFRAPTPQATPTPDVCDGAGAGCLVVAGCTDPNAVNYNPNANLPDGTCEYCFDNGTSLHLVTDHPSKLLPERCGLASNGDLELACRASQKYPKTIVSILSPFTGDQPFDTEFVDQGRQLNSAPAHWTWSPGELCTNDYDGVFAWDDLLKDDDSTRLVRTDMDNLVMFTGFVALDMFEQLEPLRGVNLTRWMRQKLPFRIIFDTDVLMTTGEVEIHDTTNALFAIIEQKTIVVDPSSSPPAVNADIILWSSVQWPYRLVVTGISVNVPSLNNPQLSVTLHEDCALVGQNDCNQKFLIHVNLQDRCTFTGRYTVTFDIECMPGANAAQCPLPDGQYTAEVDFDLQSENVCAQIVDEVVAIGSARSYNAARVGTQPYAIQQHYGFMVNQFAYYEIDVESIDGLVVETTVTKIELCFDVGCPSPILLYNGAALVPAVQLAVIDYPRNPVTSSLPTKSDIHIFLSDTVFNVPIDGSLDFQLRVELDVEYYSTATLLDDGAERDPKMISLESVRHSPKTRKLHLTSAAQEDSMSVSANGNVNGPDRPSSSDADASPRGVTPAADADGSASAAQTSYIVMVAMSVFVIALTVTLWR